MKKKTKERLIETLAIQTKTYHTDKMVAYIKGAVSSIKGCEVVEDNGNVYVTRGEALVFPCIVAHTDTVHNMVDEDYFQIFETDFECLFSMDISTMSQVGIGGDDKVGVFIALEALRETPNIKVVFFRDEEHGCLGSKQADMEFFDDVGFVIQCDRKGYEDVVKTISGEKLYSEEFGSKIAPLVNKYKRKQGVFGGMTDVYQLADKGLKISVTNLSCGYYNPHRSSEFIDVYEVNQTLLFVLEMITLLAGKTWTQLRIRLPKLNKGNVKNYNSWDSYGGWGDWRDWEDEVGTRSHVGKTIDKDKPQTLKEMLAEDEEHDCDGVCILCSDITIWDITEEAYYCYNCMEYSYPTKK